MQLCYLCKEWFSPTNEVLEAWINTGYDWDPANWICPACEEALLYAEEQEVYGNMWLEEQARYEDEKEDYEHPF